MIHTQILGHPLAFNNDSMILVTGTRSKTLDKLFRVACIWYILLICIVYFAPTFLRRGLENGFRNSKRNVKPSSGWWSWANVDKDVVLMWKLPGCYLVMDWSRPVDKSLPIQPINWLRLGIISHVLALGILILSNSNLFASPLVNQVAILLLLFFFFSIWPASIHSPVETPLTFSFLPLPIKNLLM